MRLAEEFDSLRWCERLFVQGTRAPEKFSADSLALLRSLVFSCASILRELDDEEAYGGD